MLPLISHHILEVRVRARVCVCVFIGATKYEVHAYCIFTVGKAFF